MWDKLKLIVSIQINVVKSFGKSPLIQLKFNVTIVRGDGNSINITQNSTK